jgi:hypothetical protein
MTEWLADLGDPAPCVPCAELPTDAHLLPDVEWTHQEGLLNESLRERLGIIYERRSTKPEQHYVSFAAGVGNPDFSNEATYGDRPLPDVGFRLLALYRFWNIIEYWFPYRDVIGEDWADVLVEFIPRVMAAGTVEEYRLTLMQLVARVNDTHANLWRNLDIRPPRGSRELPVLIQFIEGKPVVVGFSHPELGPATGLEVGDTIEAMDGDPIQSLLDAWAPFYAASNETKRLLDIARAMTRGESDSVLVTVSRVGGDVTLNAPRAPLAELDRQVGRTHDLPGETFQLLSDEVAYLKLSSVVSADIDEYLTGASGAQVLVIDIRNYPAEFVVFSLGGHVKPRCVSLDGARQP